MSDGDVQGSRWKTMRMGVGGVAGPERAAPEGPTGTFIGSGARFEGTLRLQGDFRIDTEFHGGIKTAGTLTVGESGSVEGEIHAREVEIRGAVLGNVFARRLLVLWPGARLHGDIETACLEMQRGAFFQGTTAMTRPQASTRAASRDKVSPGHRGRRPARVVST